MNKNKIKNFSPKLNIFILFIILKINLRHSRSRSVSKSKEKNSNKAKESIVKNALSNKNGKKYANVLSSNFNKVTNKRYESVKSKVGLMLKGQNRNQDEIKKNNYNSTQKTAVKNNKAEINNNLLNNKKSSSVPVKDRKTETINKKLVNNNILNKIKKFKAESTLKNLFSENPLLKINRNKTLDKKRKQEENAVEESKDIQKNENKEILMSIEKNESLYESTKKNKSGSQVNLNFLI